jgi:hypothetical protein
VFNLEDELHTRFTGTAIELMPIVLIQGAFTDGDTYRWHKVSSPCRKPFVVAQIPPSVC